MSDYPFSERRWVILDTSETNIDFLSLQVQTRLNVSGSQTTVKYEGTNNLLL